MVVLLLLSLVPLLVHVGSPNLNGSARMRHRCMTVVAVVVVLVMGLRSRFIGSADTNTYCTVFENIHNFENFSTYWDYIGHSSKNLLFSEVGFYFYVWIVSKLTGNTVIFLIISSSIMIYGVFKFIQDNSDDCMLAVFMFITQGSLVFCMNGMRQALAMSICLLSYRYARRRKPVKFLLVLVLAMLFHKTAFIFGIVYFIPVLRYNWKAMFAALLAVLAFIMFADRAISLFDDLADKNYSGSDVIASGGYVVLMVYGVIVLIALLYRNWQEDEATTSAFWLTLFAAILFGSRYILLGAFERVSYYFAFFSYILLPNVLSRIRSKDNRKVITAVLIVLSLILFAYRTSNSSFAVYRFFFEGG